MMAIDMDDSHRKGIGNSPTIVTIRRALGISKTYAIMTVVFMALAIVVWNPAYYSGVRHNASNSTASNSVAANAIAANSIAKIATSGPGSGIPFIAIPLDIIPALMVSTSVLILFVYDKNNGVFEYFLSLGMTQKDIYMRYLKATLLLALVIEAAFVVLDVVYISIIYGTAAAVLLLPVQLITLPFALAVLAFMVMAMMAFSSLQKTRAGSNQPLGFLVGWLATLPAYVTAILLPFETALHADIAVTIIIAMVSLAFLRASDRLISREKLLP